MNYDEHKDRVVLMLTGEKCRKEGGGMKYELNKSVIDSVLTEIKPKVKSLMNENVVKIILFGSCSRGDFKPDSDIDIAVITRSDREKNKKYTYDLAGISTEIAMKYPAVVNFICIPAEEFISMTGYSFFMNIKKEGVEI